MKPIQFALLALLLTTGLGTPKAHAQVPLNVAYQGYLTDADGTPISEENAALFFRLYDQPTDGTTLWAEKQTGVAVSEGVFAVRLGSVEALDPNLFKNRLYLSVAVGAEGAPELTPRVPLVAAPYSLRAARLDEAALKAGANVSIAPDPDGALVIAAEDSEGNGGAAWQLTGNADTDPTTDFLGTSDDMPLVMGVGKEPAFRLEPAGVGDVASTPNVIGGFSGNAVADGVGGATIGGGGAMKVLDGRSGQNEALGNFATVGGGAGNAAGGRALGYTTVGGGELNTASGEGATIAGGSRNTADGSEFGFATVGGGEDNDAGGDWATVGGGRDNTAEGRSATIGGGDGNTARGIASVVPGGTGNAADADYSSAAGRSAAVAASHTGTFVWADSGDEVAEPFTSTATNQFLIRASGGVGIGTNVPSAPLTVAGMVESTEGRFGSTDETPVELHVNNARVMRFEPETATDGPNVIAGYSSNSVDDGVVGATIAGGGDPDQNGFENPNRVTATYGTVGGGMDNTAGGHAATVVGGRDNLASEIGATVGGGFSNEATGKWATVPGGSGNRARGDYSLAAGRFALVREEHDGAFIWADSEDAAFSSTGPDQFLIRAAGGVGVNTNAPAGLLHVQGTGEDEVSIYGADAVPLLHFRKTSNGADWVFRHDDGRFHVQTEASDGNEVITLETNGAVGIGTTDPGAQLHAVAERNGSDQDPTQHVAFFENTSTGTRADVLALKVGTPGFPGANVNFATFLDGEGDVVGQIQGNGTGGVAFASASGDYAEYLPRLDPREEIAAGEVVGVVGGRVTKQTEGAEQVMVVSNRAIVEGNMPEADVVDQYELVAMLGQVPVRVRGVVEAGDFIAPSGRGDGTAVAIAPGEMHLADHAQVIGRAWETVSGSDMHEANVAVGLDRIGALIDQLQRQKVQIDALRRHQHARAEQFRALKNKVEALGQRFERVQAQRFSTGSPR